MKRRWLAGVAAVALAGGVAAWALARRGPPIVVRVEPGPLFVGHVDAMAGGRSPGCDLHAERPEGRAFTEGARTFYVWGPSDDAAPTQPKPIVLAFHGWGSNGRGFQKWFEMEKYVEDGAYVVYPDALDENWDYAGDRDVRFSAAIVERLAATYCVDTTRVLAVGFSYGGRFVNHLACRAPTLVRGIVVAGSRWDRAETTCPTPVPVLVVHRTRDDTMPIAGGRDAAERWAKIAECTGTEPVSNGCVAWTGCREGAVTFCEDRHYDPEWPRAWNHTIRESYLLLAWRWFEQLR